MNIWGKILKWCGWKVDITDQIADKCVICVAPHTSNWDFLLGMFAYKSLGRKFNFLIKESWFFFPMNLFFKSLGGIPVPSRGSKGELTKEIIKSFATHSYVNLAVTPEGTRSRCVKWRTGFLYISYGAHVPVYLGVIDYKNKNIIIRDYFIPTGDITADMSFVKEYYKEWKDVALYPDKFAVD